MTRVLLLQLPIPRQNFGRRSGNIPLGAACIKQAARGLRGVDVAVLPESLSSSSLSKLYSMAVVLICRRIFAFFIAFMVAG